MLWRGVLLRWNVWRVIFGTEGAVKRTAIGVSVPLTRSVTPQPVEPAGTPVGLTDARQVEAGMIDPVEHRLMIGNVIYHIAVMLGQTDALTSPGQRCPQSGGQQNVPVFHSDASPRRLFRRIGTTVPVRISGIVTGPPAS